MARPANADPLEKFRFRVTVIALDLSADAAITTLANLAPGGTVVNNLAVITRAGFSKIAPLPKAEVKAMTYRENLDNLRSIKVPGLATYNDVTLSRGVTANRDLYDWYRLVNEEIALLNVANEFSRDQNLITAQSDNYRKDVVIEVLDREGEPVKAWYLFNAWPTSYTPGSSLDAADESKLVEELTLTYENFIELEGGPEGLVKELAKGLFVAAAAKVANRVSDSILEGL